MRRPLWIILALVMLSLTAAQPFFSGALPLSADGRLHLYRLVSYDHTGVLFPRYAPGMAYGYGAPLFNYYPPLSLLPMQLLHGAGLSYVAAFLAAMVLYTFMAAGSMFLLGQAWGGARGTAAGFIAAAAYVYAPYLLFNSIWRGAVAEYAALALLPGVLWALHRWLLNGSRANLVLVTLCFAALVLTHHITSLYGAGLLLLYGLLIGALHGQGRRAALLLRLALALVLPLLLTAFFWLPVLLETDDVKIDAITAALPAIDVLSNFAPVTAALRPPLIPADPTQLQPPIPVALSLAQLVLALPALVLLVRRRGPVPQRALIAWALAGILLLLFMTTPASAAVWHWLPLLRYSQFPWRLLGPASLLLALTVALGVARRPRLAAVAVMLYALPWIVWIPLPEVQPQTICDAQDFERESGLIATSSFGEFLPRQVAELPDAERRRALCSATGIPPRLTPPPGVTLHHAAWEPTAATLRLTAATPTELVFDWLYVPAFAATLNGATVPVTPTVPHGLVSVAVPAGEHTLEVRLGSTPVQTLANGITLAGLAGGLLLLLLRRPWRTSPPATANTPPDGRLALHMLLLGLLIFGLKTLVIDRGATPLLRERFAGGLAQGVAIPLLANFNHEIRLIGLDAYTPVAAAGDTVPLTLYWQLWQAAIPGDYSSVVTLRDAAGLPVTEQIDWQPGAVSTFNWRPGYYLQQRVALSLPPHTPPGEYTLEVALYDPAAARSLDVLNADGNPQGVAVVAGRLTVARPARPAPVTEPPLLSADGLSLLAVDALPAAASVGDALTLSALWRVETNAPPAVVRLAWGDAAAQAMTVIEDGWQPGDTWRVLRRVYVPGDLAAGTYPLHLYIGSAGVKIGTMTVRVPPREWATPAEMAAPVAAWANGLRLLRAETAGGRIRLVWSTTRRQPESRHLFVHGVAEDGRILAQCAGIPADWQRPITGWARGERVLTTCDLSGAGAAAYVIGWYDPSTGARVP
ncbi:MAG: 6-pyruvoyl-tetrahydropterin synthase-related protein, partial [Anaerolineae bacterium]|nr:6-pyruvoyl-tetrahydropterin synthase-related protein [Anaerolineae bacterium]